MAGMIELNNNLHTQFARAQAFIPKQILGFLMLLKFLFEEYLWWYSRPVEVFLHRKFGVRGHGLFITIQLCAVAIVVCWAGINHDPPAGLFCIASAVLAVYHRIEAVRSEMRGVVRHSYSNGEPLPIWAWLARIVQAFGIDPSRFITASLICRFYEPALVLALGLVMRSVSQALGTYLLACSVALFIKNLIVHNRLLNMKRDQIDARIMSSWLASIHRTMTSGPSQEQYFVVQLAEVPVRKRDDDDGGEVATLPEKQPASETAIVNGSLLRFSCRKCKTEFRVPRKYGGKKGRCKKCGEVAVVAAALN
jgi:hypothetical protein